MEGSDIGKTTSGFPPFPPSLPRSPSLLTMRLVLGKLQNARHGWNHHKRPAHAHKRPQDTRCQTWMKLKGREEGKEGGRREGGREGEHFERSSVHRARSLGNRQPKDERNNHTYFSTPIKDKRKRTNRACLGHGRGVGGWRRPHVVIMPSTTISTAAVAAAGGQSPPPWFEKGRRKRA